MDTSVIIYSCDKYSDVWNPFFTLLFRYWDCPYKVYIAAEKKICPMPKTETLNHEAEKWTERIRACLEDIPADYVIGMCEDFFLRKPVRQNIIDKCIEYMKNDNSIACFNFEKEYDWVLPSKYPEFGKKPDGGSYRKSCQPTLWRKSILLELMNQPMDPWEWEMSPADDKYKYFIYTGPEEKLVFEYGYHNNQWFGIQKGCWVAKDIVPLFEREGIKVDYSKRGLI